MDTSLLARQLCLAIMCIPGTLSGDRKTENKLDPDGFPPIGTLLQEGDPYYR